MKNLLTFIFLSLLFLPNNSKAQSYADPKEISKFALVLFKKTCLTQLSSPEKIVSFMDKNFPKLDDEKKKIFLNLTHADSSATGWFVYIPNKATMVMVLDTAQKSCHLISPMGDANAAHDEFKKMYSEAKESLPQSKVILLEEKKSAPNNGPINSSMDISFPGITLSTILSTGNGVAKGAYQIFITSFIHKNDIK